MQHKITLSQLTDWAENAIMEDGFEEKSLIKLVSRIGLADVKAFGLLWEDCEIFFKELGYNIKIDFTKVA